MADKKRNKWADYLVFAVVRIAYCVLQALSFEMACSFADFLAWLIHRVDKRHRLVAHENITKAFPGQYTPQQVDRLVWETYRHFCRVLMEIVFLKRRMQAMNWRKHVVMYNTKPLTEALLCGRPCLLVTGHFGNWEVSSYLLSLLGFPSYAIARPLDNPYVDDFLRGIRESTGQKMLAKRGDFDQMDKVLATGGVLATLADQDAGPRGIFVDFFGRPASTHKAVALMAMEHQVTMVVTCTVWRNGKYHVLASDRIEPADYERTPEGIKAMTQRFTSELEKLIRQAPEQYFWLHRRWKHQPPVRAKKQAAA